MIFRLHTRGKRNTRSRTAFILTESTFRISGPEKYIIRWSGWCGKEMFSAPSYLSALRESRVRQRKLDLHSLIYGPNEKKINWSRGGTRNFHFKLNTISVVRSPADYKPDDLDHDYD